MITRVSYQAIVDPAQGGKVITRPDLRRHGTVIGFSWHGLDGHMGNGNVVAVVLQDGNGARPVLVPVRQADFGVLAEDTQQATSILAGHYHASK